jgi:hypothetical protein
MCDNKLCKLCHRIHDFFSSADCEPIYASRLGGEACRSNIFQPFFSPNCQAKAESHCAFEADPHPMRRRKRSRGEQSTNRSNARILVLLRFVIRELARAPFPRTQRGKKKFFALCFEQQKRKVLANLCKDIRVLFIFITSTLDSRKEGWRRRGSRSAESLLVDLKVEVLACNVEPLEAVAKAVEVFLQARS